MNRRRILKGMCELALGLFLILLGCRLLVQPPRPSDPPDMHAFYRAWLQPPWWMIAAPLAFALLAPWAYAGARIAWATFKAHRARREWDQAFEADCEAVECECAEPMLFAFPNEAPTHCARCGMWLKGAYRAARAARGRAARARGSSRRSD